MTTLEYLLSSFLLRVVGWIASRRPVRRGRVVIATARLPNLEGNLAYLHEAFLRRRPDLDYALLLEPYSYGLLGKVAYLFRLIRGMWLLRTSGLVVVDNAWLPIHVAPHRRETTVVQVWHAVGALKRFGVDTARPPEDPERRFLHRNYDYVVCAGEAAREPYARAFRTPVERVLPLGAPRTDFFFRPEELRAARERVLAAYPQLRGKRVVLYAPTFRGRGRGKRGAPSVDARAIREALPPDHAIALKTHPNLDPAATATAGYDAVIDRRLEINEVFAATDVFVTDYSSSIYEWALLGRPLVLLTSDLAEYERDPGMYVDFRTEMIGRKVADPADLPRAIRDATVDHDAWAAFVSRHIGACDGRASARVAERFLPA